MDISKKIRSEYGSSERDRKHSRFTIPGATISLDESRSGYGGCDPSRERSPVVNLSMGGVSFLTNNPPKVNGISFLLTYAEDEEPLRLEGRVAYFVSCAGLSHRFRVGVEFAPFSAGRSHNSLESLIRLERLERTYGE